MKTLEQINAEIESLKQILTQHDIGDDTKNLIDGAVGELYWVAGDSPQLISLSQIIIGAENLMVTLNRIDRERLMKKLLLALTPNKHGLD